VKIYKLDKVTSLNHINNAAEQNISLCYRIPVVTRRSWQKRKLKAKAGDTGRVYLFTGLDHWTGLLDWTTGLTFDPKILTKNDCFALVGGPKMPSLLSCLLWSGKH
jgi:hypothetical protein